MHPLFAEHAGTFIQARTAWYLNFIKHWPTFKFLGVQYADHVPFALHSNEWFPASLFDWAKAVPLVSILEEMIYGKS